MVKILDIERLDEKVKDFLLGLSITENKFIVELDGKPIIGFVPPDMMNRLLPVDIYERIWNKNDGVNTTEVEQDVMEAVTEVRAQRKCSA